MSYRKLSSTEFETLVSELERDYTEKENSKRVSFIAFLKQFSEQLSSANITEEEKTDLLTAAGVFGIELIVNEYKVFSPERSDLYVLLNDKLKINPRDPAQEKPAQESKLPKNPLKNEERLYYLNKLFKYMGSDHFTEEQVTNLKKTIPDFIWQDKKALHHDVRKMLKQVKVRNADRINQLVKATPELDGLRKNMEELPGLYEKADKELAQSSWLHAWFHDAEREKMLRLIKLVDKACYKLYEAGEEKSQRLQEVECKIRKGLIIFVLLKIYRKYKILSPQGGFFNHGSELFKKSLNALNVGSLFDLKYDWKIDWLKALSEHVDDIHNDPNFYQESELLWNAEKSRKEDPFKKALPEFQKNVDRYVNLQEEEKNNPSLRSRIVSTGTSCASQYGIMVGLGFAFKQGAKTLASATLGVPVGIAILLLMSGVGQKAGGYLLTWMIEKISTRIGDKVADIVDKDFLFTKEGFEKLWNHLTSEEQRDFQQWVNTLLDLPNDGDLGSEEEKKHIRNVLGLAEGDKFEKAPKLVQQNELPKTQRFFAELSFNENYQSDKPVQDALLTARIVS